MFRTQGYGVKGVLATLIIVSFVTLDWGTSLAHAKTTDLPPRDQVDIGVPNTPRRIREALPEVRPNRGIDLGILRLHPYFSSRLEYDDNVNLAESDAKEDVRFVEKPAVTVDMEVGGHKFEAGYSAEINEYVKNTEENHVNQLAGGSMELNFDELTITAKDSYEKTTSRVFTETSVRDKIAINAVNVAGRYDRPNWAGELNWTHNTINHLTPEFEANDYNEDVIVLLGGYKVQPDTLALLEIGWGTIYYGEADGVKRPQQSYWQIFTGFQGEPTVDIELIAKIGYQGRFVEGLDAVELSKLGLTRFDGIDDFHGVVADVDVTYRLTAEDVIRSGYIRTPKASTFGANSWYVQNKLFASYRKRFFDKLFVTPQFSWQYNDYPDLGAVGGVIKERVDAFWNAALKVQYKMQDWLWFTGSYSYRARDSKFEALDYGNNRFLFDITFSY